MGVWGGGVIGVGCRGVGGHFGGHPWDCRNGVIPGHREKRAANDFEDLAADGFQDFALGCGAYGVSELGGNQVALVILEKRHCLPRRMCECGYHPIFSRFWRVAY